MSVYRNVSLFISRIKVIIQPILGLISDTRTIIYIVKEFILEEFWMKGEMLRTF